MDLLHNPSLLPLLLLPGSEEGVFIITVRRGTEMLSAAYVALAAKLRDTDSLILTVVAVVAATYTVAWACLHLSQDAKEPALAPCAIPIPFIGPAIEMRWKRTGFPLYMK